MRNLLTPSWPARSLCLRSCSLKVAVMALMVLFQTDGVCRGGAPVSDVAEVHAAAELWAVPKRTSWSAFLPRLGFQPYQFVSLPQQKKRMTLPIPAVVVTSSGKGSGRGLPPSSWKRKCCMTRVQSSATQHRQKLGMQHMQHWHLHLPLGVS